MQIQLKFDSHKFITWLDNIELRQIPYAQSRALNDCAKLAVFYAKEHATRGIENRKNWIPKSINYTRSDKKQNPIQVEVYSHSNWMKWNEKGQIHRSKGTRKLGRPFKIRESKSDSIRKSDQPASIFNKIDEQKRKARKRRSSKRHAFVLTLKSGKHALAVRTSKARKPLKILYTFTKEVKWNPKFSFAEMTSKIMAANIDDLFKKWLDQAVRTDR